MTRGDQLSSGGGRAGSQTKTCVRTEALWPIHCTLLSTWHSAWCMGGLRKHLWKERVNIMPLPPHQPGGLGLLLRFDYVYLQKSPPAPALGRELSQGMDKTLLP